MHIYKSSMWTDDIERELSVLPELDEIAGSTVMVTGASGLICSAIIDIIIRYNETHNIPIMIIAAGRHLEKIHKRFKEYCKKAYFRIIFYDTLKNNSLKYPCEYIIHGASNAYPSAIIEEPVETMVSNFNGLLYLLHYAREFRVKKVLFISSSEIYGKKENDKSHIEEEYGYIDFLNPRNAYAVGKCAAETLCTSYASEYGVESVIVRPGHIYGPTASLKDNRVSSLWAYAAAYGNNIVLKSDGNQRRSYCYCLDCASAILKVLMKGKNNSAYNISNPNSILSIQQLAEIMAEAGNTKLIYEEAAEEEKKSFNPMSDSSLDSKRLTSLGWRALFDAEVGVYHTIHILKEILHVQEHR